VGGGSIVTPLLITVFGVPAPVAVGTDLACAAVTKTAGTFAHRAARNVKGSVVKLLALGSISAAIVTLTVLAAAQLNAHQFDRLIREGVGVVLLVSIAVLLWRTIRSGAGRQAPRRSPRFDTIAPRPRCSLER
jgi:uncharacterized protein